MDESPTPRPAPAIYVLAAHPNWRESRVNRRLAEAARREPRVALCDLYARYPDYDIDVAAEQTAAQAADLLVLQHPIQWYSMPALMKLWLDEVLTFGWAYGRAGNALRGKDLWLVATTGGPETAYHPTGYNRYFFEAFLPPYEQTATLCGMRFVPPLVLHGAHRAEEAAVTAHVDVYAERLRSYPAWPELEDLDQCPIFDVPQIDRPRESEG